MFRRRVQKLGGSSLIVTLPKNWVKRMNIGVGDSVIVVDEGEYLKIMPDNISPSTKSLTVDASTLPRNENTLRHFIKCVYAHGYDRLAIFSDSRSKKDEVLATEIFRSGKNLLLEGDILVRRIVARDGHIVMELRQTNDASPQIMVKTYASLLSNMVDDIIMGKFDEVEETAEKLLSLAFDIIRVSINTSNSCETTKTTYLPLLLTTLPRLLLKVAKELKKSNTISSDDKRVLEATRRTFLELLGALATGSTKRFEQSLANSKILEGILPSVNVNKEVYALASFATASIPAALELSLCRAKE
ncbi:MAG: AbrB/MazE/SpoVT family DNA-binding domain-containing protein [Aeropyrum sp.]|nr:AbrB/MazE/SpoVT family DNA-binding domain-containing protein [Aeropyrum sp.]MCE4615936.1 AbrB/MazE/SpoVT family DNA-binding domain-containing protein [Aeropyrum sp.]